ncbi:uncharacterized protein LOC107043964 [Diachasma alloeum]|uniref:uncharacterized protein LOC107043964 n=1 Tax=Diachasma alloeum TaxID=454923 RepID=UPI0007382409|nr:uncharacterized protein LOC107043964 [Diachasma alloeum]
MSFAGRLFIQASRTKFIESRHTESSSAAVKELSVTELQSKLDILENYWSQFEEQRVRLFTGKDSAEVLEYDYVKQGVYDICLQRYSTARTSFIGLIKSIDETVDLSESFCRPAAPVPSAQVTQRQLPKISLPTFSGDFYEWTPFKDLFLLMVVGNSNLSTVEKFYYLLTSLAGEPKQLISTLPVAQDSFIPAWDMLISRYDNERLLISTQLERLFSTPRIVNRTAKEFNALLNSTTEALNALKSLRRPVEHCDDVLVHIISSRLDVKTLEAWEVKIGSTTTFPTYAELREFMLNRARARERIELHPLHAPKTPTSSVPSQPLKAKPAKVLNVSTGSAVQQARGSTSQSWADLTANACSMCEEEHFIDKCPKFKQLSPEKRKEFVEKKYLCFNCLGKHSISACRTTKTCVVCHKRHHSMIHITRPQNGSLESSQPDQLKSQDSLAVKLGLLKSPALLPVVGIGGSRSFSKEFSQFCLKFLHSDKHLQIKAYILDHLTSSLPSFSVSDTQAWGHLEGLTLADPEYIEPRPIDLLVGADFFGSIVEPQIIKGFSDSPIAMQTIFGWVVLGPTSAVIPMLASSNHIAVSNEELYDLLTSFWLQEEVPKSEDSGLTEEEAECEEFFQRTHS